MPMYDFLDSESGEIKEILVRMSEYDEFLRSNPNLSRHYGGQAPNVLYRGEIKATGGFKEVLERIQRNTPGANLNI